MKAQLHAISAPNAVAEAREEGQMDEEPGEEAEEPAVAQAVEAHDRVPTTDGGHAAEVAVAERLSLAACLRGAA